MTSPCPAAIIASWPPKLPCKTSSHASQSGAGITRWRSTQRSVTWHSLQVTCTVMCPRSFTWPWGAGRQRAPAAGVGHEQQTPSALDKVKNADPDYLYLSICWSVKEPFFGWGCYMFRLMLLSLSRIVIFVWFLSFGFVVLMYGTIYWGRSFQLINVFCAPE